MKTRKGFIVNVYNFDVAKRVQKLCWKFIEREGIGGGGGDKGSPGAVMGGAPERWCGGDGQDFAGVEYMCTYL